MTRHAVSPYPAPSPSTHPDGECAGRATCAADNGRESQVRWAELAISHVLRGGVLLSLAIVVIGAALTFIQHPNYLDSASAYKHLISRQAPVPRTLGGVLHGVAHLRGEAVVGLGLVVLLLTPVVRVAISILLFLTQGDRTYVVITTVVLALLVASFMLGRVEH